MPPAFNLSQDQTLQFNLCKLSSKLTWKNQFHVSIRVFLFAKHHITYVMQRRPPTPNAHTYRLLIFKEQAFNELCILAQSLYISQETLKKARTEYGLFMNRVSDDVLLSRARAHYHRRKSVSRSCSGWEGVVPLRYGRQTKLVGGEPGELAEAGCRCLIGVDECIGSLWRSPWFPTTM